MSEDLLGIMKRVLVTGGTGFIGRRLVSRLLDCGVCVSVLTRDPESAQALWRNRGVHIRRGDITDQSTLHGLCDEHDTVFHLAGYAHSETGNCHDLRSRHEAVSVTGTRSLLRLAREARVQFFVYLSSVKAMGETNADQLDEHAPPRPTTDYGRARLAAEELVLAAGKQNGMHVAVIRIPLVYGPGNKGNLLSMVEAIDHGRFPPWPGIENRRSMVHVDDVMQAMLLAALAPAANGEVFIVTDGRTYSTREMYEAICRALGRSVPAWTIPVWMLRLGAMVGSALQRVTGRPMPLTVKGLDKLLGSAWYSPEKTRRLLGFSPTFTFHDALPEIIAEYRASHAVRTGMAPGR